jgi:hypothetical protein
VGRGVDRRFEEKNLEGSGKTVDLACENWKGLFSLLLDIASLNWYEWYSSCFCVIMLLKKAKCCLRWFNGYVMVMESEVGVFLNLWLLVLPALELCQLLIFYGVEAVSL